MRQKHKFSFGLIRYFIAENRREQFENQTNPMTVIVAVSS